MSNEDDREQDAGRGTAEPYEKMDDGLRVLLQVRERIAPDLSQGLLEHCYRIQKKHQFDREHERPLNLTRDAVEAFIGEEAGSVEESD